MASAPSPPPTRRDAVRNRARLARAATAAFREDGLDVAVDAIARRAGVGVATLYRHFPTKLELIVAVTEAVLEDLQTAARVALDEPDVLRAFLTSAMEQQHENRGFLESLTQQALPEDAREDLADRVVAMLAPIASAAHAAGTLASHLGAEDLLLAVRMLGASATTVRPRPPTTSLAVVLGGLAAPADG
ncbi:MAG TPA: helix-turn-helix domain-containing protein [Baekduia sp.]